MVHLLLKRLSKGFLLPQFHSRDLSFSCLL